LKDDKRGSLVFSKNVCLISKNKNKNSKHEFKILTHSSYTLPEELKASSLVEITAPHPTANPSLAIVQ
jgi:hypothetical protein